MADQWYKFGAGFLLVYSITDRPTFEAVRSFHEEILRAKDRDYVPCVVVSNKVGQSARQGRDYGDADASAIWADYELWASWKDVILPSRSRHRSSSARRLTGSTWTWCSRSWSSWCERTRW